MPPIPQPMTQWFSSPHATETAVIKEQPFPITYCNRACSDLYHWNFQQSPLESLTPYFLTYCLLLISAAAFFWISSARRQLLFFFFGFFFILCFYIVESLGIHYLILFLISYTFTLDMWSLFMHLNVILVLVKVKAKKMEYVLLSVCNLM